MSLWGVKTESECRAKIDAFLERHRVAEQTPTKDTIKDLNNELTAYYKQGDTNKGNNKMSNIESALFWPAIQEAYVRRPKLNDSSTWGAGLKRHRTLATLLSAKGVRGGTYGQPGARTRFSACGAFDSQRWR